MNALAAYVATEHLLDLRREAEAEHLVHIFRSGSAGSASGGAGSPSRRAPRIARLLSRSARMLSVALDGVAMRIDPTDRRRSSEKSEDRKARPLAA
jgi:hypothetical protein